MTSQIVANINTELKNKAMAMAKEEWLTMKALLSFLLKWYTEKKIEIWAKFSSFERDYWNLEIEELTKNEKEIFNNSKEFKDLTLSIKKSLTWK